MYILVVVSEMLCWFTHDLDIGLMIATYKFT